MRLLRDCLGVFGAILLIAGYLAAVQASATGQAAEYAAKVDAAPIRSIALLLLLAAIVLSFVPERGETE